MGAGVKPGEISISEIRALRSSMAIRVRERDGAREEVRQLWKMIEERDKKIRLLEAALKARID